MLIIRTLGGLSVARDSTVMTGAAAQRRRLAILALLARGGERGVAREKIIALLWPDHDEEHARRTLNQALYALRRDLGDDDVITGQQTLLLDPERITADTILLEQALQENRAEDAASLYTGPFLDGVVLDDADEFNRWVDAERSALHHRHAAMLEGLATAADARDDHAAAVAWWRRLAAAEPLSARVTIGLMKSLAASGDRQGAVQHARVHAMLLEQELDAPPDQSVADFAERLRTDRTPTIAAPELAPPTAVALPPHIEAAVEVHHATPATTALPLPRRRRWPAVVIGIALLGTTVWLLRDRLFGSGPHVVTGRTTHITADATLELDPDLSPDGTMIAYAAGQAGNTRIYVRQMAGGRPIEVATDLPGPLRTPRWSPDGQTLAIGGRDAIYGVPALGGATRVLIAFDSVRGAPHSPAWSPNKRSLAYIRENRLMIRTVPIGRERLVTTLDDPHTIAFSPDSRWIAVVSGNAAFTLGSRAPATLGANLGNRAPSTIYVLPVRVNSGAPVAITARDHLAVSPVWAPDARHLLFLSDADGSRDVWMAEMSTKGQLVAPAARLTTGLGAHSMALSRDGATLAYSLFRQSSNIWTAAIDGGPISVRAATPVTSGTQLIEGIALSPDGQRLAFDSDRDGTQDLWQVAASGGEASKLGGTTFDDFLPTWSPDGLELAYHVFRRGVRQISIMPATGGVSHPVTLDSVDTRDPAWSPDGASLLVSRWVGDRYELFLTTRGSDRQWGPPTQLTRTGGQSGRWSPDGREIAYLAPQDSNALLVMPAAGGTSRTLVRGTGAAERPFPATIQWHRDGRSVI
ncbi:MAG: PD40 domain-containing protein [Gemmatimonadetes bacterium]|nr:PD40 domain-containing protein [Gemmatimonadota bacterium]